MPKLLDWTSWPGFELRHLHLCEFITTLSFRLSTKNKSNATHLGRKKTLFFTFILHYHLFLNSILKNTYSAWNLFTGSFGVEYGNWWTGETNCGRGDWKCGITGGDCEVLCCCHCGGGDCIHGRLTGDWKSRCICAGGGKCDGVGGRRMVCDGDCGVGGDNVRYDGPPQAAAKSNCRANFRLAKSSVVSLFSMDVSS